VEPVPTLVLIDVPSDDVLESTSTTDTEPAPDDHGKTCVSHDGTSELYGYNLLQSIVTGLKTQHPSNPVVPIVVNDIHKDHAIDAMDYPRLLPNTFYTNPFDKTPKPGAGVTLPQEHQRAFRFISAGAVDVLTKPINPEQLLGVALHVYRVSKNTVEGNVVAHQPSRERKRSWVGVDDTKPYSYLREEMVSGLMDAICGFSEEIKLPIAIPLYVEESRKQAIMDSVGNWNFSAHDYSDDELLHCGLVMLEHALELPELEEWRLTTGKFDKILSETHSTS
jgi:3',5'-cyclic-nucleotide phosphodiesterase